MLTPQQYKNIDKILHETSITTEQIIQYVVIKASILEQTDKDHSNDIESGLHEEIDLNQYL